MISKNRNKELLNFTLAWQTTFVQRCTQTEKLHLLCPLKHCKHFSVSHAHSKRQNWPVALCLTHNKEQTHTATDETGLLLFAPRIAKNIIMHTTTEKQQQKPGLFLFAPRITKKIRTPQQKNKQQQQNGLLLFAPRITKNIRTLGSNLLKLIRTMHHLTSLCAK